MGVPSRIRGVLESFIEDLRAREVISGIGLFGSWSRGDASPSSDIDLLIVESRDFDYEYFERIELNGHLVDLNYVPRQWIIYRVPPEIDQKLYELQIIFDRDNSLSRARDLMLKVYWRPERVEIRTEAQLIEADAYLSRARAAFNRGDYRSVKVNSVRGFWALMKILTEIGRRPILSSHFMRNLEAASRSIEMYNLYEDYISLMDFAGLSRTNVKSLLEFLSSAWKGIISSVSPGQMLLKSLHPKVAAKLNYYGREIFLKGLVARVSALLDEAAPIEAAHYMFHVLADMLENYALLISVAEGVRFDHSVLLKFLGESKMVPAEVYQNALNVFNAGRISSQEAEEDLKTTVEAAMNIRQRRKDLISRFIG